MSGSEVAPWIDAKLGRSELESHLGQVLEYKWKEMSDLLVVEGTLVFLRKNGDARTCSA